MSQYHPQALSSLKTNHSQQENAMTRLHQKLADSIKDYNQNILWLKGQINAGNISNRKLIEIIATVTQVATHQSPIEQAIDKLYIDPKLASILENQTIDTPDHISHLAAKLLTLNKLSQADFPIICQSFSIRR